MTSIQRSATIAGTREVHEPLEAKEAIETVEEAVGRNISTRFPLNSAFIFTFGALGGMLFGFDTGIISGASPLIESDFGLSVSQTGFITSSVLIGSCVGALSIGTLSDRFGRKKLLILSAILFLIGSGMCATATGFLMMVAARIILGLAVGAASALTPAYLAELAPKERRGSLSTLFQLMITFGILLAYASNLGFLGHNIAGVRDWRWMLGSALIPAALLLIGGILLPESPRYLVSKGDERNAFKVLTLIRKDVDQTQVQLELDEIKEVAAQDTKGGVRELFRIARPALIAAVGIMLFQQLVGINSVIYFLPQVFIKGFGFPENHAIWVSVGIGVVNFAATIVATLIMDRFPRKKLLVFGSVVMTVSLAALAILNFTGDVSTLAVPPPTGLAISWSPSSSSCSLRPSATMWAVRSRSSACSPHCPSRSCCISFPKPRASPSNGLKRRWSVAKRPPIIPGAIAYRADVHGKARVRSLRFSRSHTGFMIVQPTGAMRKSSGSREEANPPKRTSSGSRRRHVAVRNTPRFP